MALAILNELQERLHTGAIAGAGVIGEDFRLRRTAEQFAAASAKSPVLARIHSLLTPLLDPDCENRSAALIDAITLVDAVVCTQADYAVEGELLEAPVTEGAPFRPCKYGEVMPLLTALTSKGSGRYEVIQSAYERHAPALYDFRLRAALVQALGDGYGEIADLAQKVLCEGQANVVPLLKRGFDPKGKREMVRRVQVIAAVAGERENEFYLSLLENAAAPIREEAIRALGRCEENDELLIGLTGTERGNPRRAALVALGAMGTPRAVDFWRGQLEKDPAAALPFLRLNGWDSIADLLSEWMDRELAWLLQGEPIGEKDCMRLGELLLATSNKCSPRLLAAMGRWGAQQAALARLRTPGNGQPLLEYFTAIGRGKEKGLTPDPVELLNGQLVATLLLRGEDPAACRRIADLCAGQERAFLSAGFAHALLEDDSAAYDRFAPWFDDPKTVEALLRVFALVSYQRERRCYAMGLYLSSCAGEEGRRLYRAMGERLDCRWFYLFTAQKHTLCQAFFVRPGFGDPEQGGLLARLINPDDPQSLPLLRQYFAQRAQNGEGSCLIALRDCGGADFAGLMPKYLQKQKRLNYYDMLRLYRELPMRSDVIAAELEEIASMIERGAVHTSYKNEPARMRELAKRLRAGADIQSAY